MKTSAEKKERYRDTIIERDIARESEKMERLWEILKDDEKIDKKQRYTLMPLRNSMMEKECI